MKKNENAEKESYCQTQGKIADWVELAGKEIYKTAVGFGMQPDYEPEPGRCNGKTDFTRMDLNFTEIRDKPLAGEAL